jgi:hypothetical protein
VRELGFRRSNEKQIFTYNRFGFNYHFLQRFGFIICKIAKYIYRSFDCYDFMDGDRDWI